MNHSLPDWAARLLGLETSSAGEGMQWSLETHWTWPSWFTLLFVSFAIAWVVHWYLREDPSVSHRAKLLLAAQRLAAIAVLLCMLTELTLSFQQTGLPSVVVLVDRSASMSIADQYEDESLRKSLATRLKQLGLDQPTRLNLAKLILLEKDKSLLEDLRQNYNLNFYFIGENATLESDDAEDSSSANVDPLATAIRQQLPNDTTSRLGQAVRTVLADLRGTPPAAILLLTDGVTTDGPTVADAAQYARRRGVPLLTVALGTRKPVRDIELSDLLVDEVVFLDDVVYFDGTISSLGFSGERVEVTLRQQGSETVLAHTEVTLDSDGSPRKVRLAHRPSQVGEFEFVMEVTPLDGEAQVENNRSRRAVSVRKQKIRVLLAWAYPSYEFRYLKHLLERDESIELATVLQSASPDYAQVDRTARRVFPVSRDELYRFDVVLFGDVDPAPLSSSVMTNLVSFVQERGGGIVFIAGPRYLPHAYLETPLASLFPLTFDPLADAESRVDHNTPFQVRPTEIGQASSHMQLGNDQQETDTIWNELPPLYWHRRALDIKPGAHVLAEHPDQADAVGRSDPLFCYQYVGAGKVLFHTIDSTWRWRFQIGDRYFARYWVQTIRMLARAKLLGERALAEVTVDRRQYRHGETARLRVRFFDERRAPAVDDGVEVIVEQAGGKKRRMRLRRYGTNRGLFEVALTDLIEGDYHAWLADPSAPGAAPAVDFLVVAPPGEFERIETDFAGLKKAAEETQGRYYSIETVSKLRGELPPGRPIPIRSLPPEPLWSRWWTLFLFLALLTSEWISRKRLGML